MIKKEEFAEEPIDKRAARRGGFYWIGDPSRPFVTVTTVISILDKPALRYWSGKEIYYALVKDPSLSEQEALAAPYKKSKSAMSRGTAVHDIIEHYVHNKKTVEGIDEAIRPYGQAFYDWFESTDVEILDHEKTVTSEKYGYTGTLDLLVRFIKKDKVFVIDLKTGKDIYPESFLQSSAYAQALHENGIKVSGIGTLLLETGKDDKPTGDYKFQKGKYCFRQFLACQSLWYWRNREICEKVGYKLPWKGGE